MRLEAFRVQNYKNIQDTGWISCEDLMVFVGKNESGKTTLFRALSKLNPTDGAKYDKLKEFPRGRLTSEGDQQDWPVGTGRFQLDKNERAALGAVCPPLAKTKTVEVTRHYSDTVFVKYSPAAKLDLVSHDAWLKSLKDARKKIERTTPPDDKSEPWGTVKAAVTSAIDGCITKSEADENDPTLADLNAAMQAITGQMNEEWAKEILEPFLAPWEKMAELLEQEATLGKADEWVVQNMPHFLYFDNLGVLQSDIFIPDFLTKIGQGRNTQEVRVQECLFKHVGVEITKLGALGRHKAEDPDNENTRREIDELTIRCNAASQAMTKRFRDWWEQRTHAFHYEFHGNYFRIWVSDDRNPSEIELEERSAGMRYFFSFYLVFIVEAEDLHRNCILLLDEPGLHLHGTAQAKLIEFFEKMSADNQLFYTTHSPFMVDGAHLERAVALSEEDGNMRVSTEVWPRDRDSLFPLQAALGYSVCQSLFLSKKQVMVEGITDYTLLSALSQHLLAAGRCGLDRTIVMVPMGGTTNLAPLASMLIGHDVEIAVLLDSDPAGAKGMKKLRKLLTGVDQRCFQISSYGGDHEITELEDLLPEKYYLDAVKVAYPKIEIKFNASEKKTASVVDRVQQLFERLEVGPFEKWRPIHEVVQSVYRDPKGVPSELLEAAESIFKDINAALGGEV